MELAELGMTIRTARVASGISQAQLARLAQVSRATLNYAEQGRSALGADVLMRLLPPLGLAILPHAPMGQGSVPAIDLLAASASVSFKESIPPAEVEHLLLTGNFTEEWLPHVATILDEASDATLLRAVREVSAKTSVKATLIWRNLKRSATAIASPNPRWA